MDFKQGKWIINQTQSNSKLAYTKLYTNSLNEFRKILGDSLLEINEVRITSLIAPEIPFDLDADGLRELNTQTGCDYLINITDNVIHNGLGLISLPTNEEGYIESNTASVEIKIYHLESGMEISSSSVYVKLEQYGDLTQTKSSSYPTINTSAYTLMLSAAKKLIRKYDKYDK